ncbi:MAG: hypothetical protein JO189_03895 [Deltaproteobacteria bacterium]|nr:hypothetical protein [Deltaproteobacteria bacterium]
MRDDMQERLDQGRQNYADGIQVLMKDTSRELGLLRDRIVTLEVTMRFKAGLWGAVAAMIPTAVAIMLELIHK